MKTVWVGATWKMHKRLAEAERYVADLRAGLSPSPDCRVFLVVPYTHLPRIKELLAASPILLGAQNVHWAEEGAFTGEISPVMLAEIGVDLVELGHSERRRYYGEEDYSVNKKVLSVLAHGMIPLVCLGEQKTEREYGVASEVVARQLKIALHDVPREACGKFLIAYEPVWAIGEGGTPAEPQEAEAIHAELRSILNALYGEEGGVRVPILYGGSVDGENAGQFVQQPNVDGVFVGRAGLDLARFLEIVRSAQAAIERQMGLPLVGRSP